MTGYALDTNIVSALLRGDQVVRQRLEEATRAGKAVQLTALAYYESKRGLLRAGLTSKLHRFGNFCRTFGVLYLDQASLDVASEIWARLSRTGQVIEDADILMAAIAITNDVTLVTDNEAHFGRIGDLVWENWLR